MKAWLLYLLVSIFLGSCGGSPQPVEYSHPDYLTLGKDAKSKKYLIHKVFETIKINVVGDYFGQITPANIQKAVLDWISPLRKFSDDLSDEVQVGKFKLSNDLTIKLVDGDGRAHYSSFLFLNEIVLYSKGHDNFGTLLHELGHAFGLGDTYIEGVWTCQPGQPPSIMCRIPPYNPRLEKDDIEGITFLFCKYNPDLC